MKPSRSLLPAALAALLLASAHSFAQSSGALSFGKPKAAESAELVTVQAKGQGETVDAAKKDAIRNAIKKTVGELVDAKTLVENDELVEDKILTLSNAIIEKADYGEAKSVGDGLFEVPVTAVVKKGRLNQELKAVGIATGAVSGSSLAASLFSGRERLANAEKFFAERFKDFPGNVMEAVMLTKDDGEGNQVPDVEIDEKSEHVFANVGVRINLENYTEWAKQMQELFGVVCAEKEEKSISFKEDENFEEDIYNKKPDPFANDVVRRPKSEKPEFPVVVATPKKPSRAAWPVSVYYLDEMMFRKLYEVIGNRFPEACTLKVVLQDKDGEAICEGETKVVRFGVRDNICGCLPIGVDATYLNYNRGAKIFLAPYAGIRTSHVGGQETGMSRPRTETRTFRIDLGKIPVEDLGDVEGYEVKLEFGNQPTGGEA